MEDYEIIDVAAESQYTPLTDEAINQLAQDVYAGRVFGTWNIENPHDTGMVFMVLALMDTIARKKMVRDGIVHLWEHMSKAGPRAINGMPCFFSAHELNAEDTERLNTRLQKIKKAMDAIDD